MNRPISLRSYVTGFILSVLYTTVAYVVATRGSGSFWIIISVLIGLALAQLAVQLLYFLHVGEDVKPRWRLLAFFFMFIVVFILVVGSLWIMSNLNYNHLKRSPAATNSYIIKDEGVQPEANP